MSYYAYAFLTGIYIGGYTNLFSKVVISGLVLYIVHPENFNPKRFTPLYDRIYETSYPYLSKVYSFSNILNSDLDKITLPRLNTSQDKNTASTSSSASPTSTTSPNKLNYPSIKVVSK